MKQRQITILNLFIGLWLALLSGPTVARAVDETFALIQTKTALYSNVTVTTKAKDYIVIQHAGGLASVKVGELSPEVHEALGFGPAKGSRKGASFLVTAKAKALVGALPTKAIEQAWSQHSPAGTPALKLTSTILFAALGIGFGLYLFFCYCALLICRKAGQPAGWMIWVPLLQYVPILRAAKMSPLWLIAIVIPLLNIWAHILWSFRIAAARGRGFWTALFLILPTYPLAFVYLAFAGNTAAAEPSAPAEKFKTSGLVFDQG